MDSKNTSGSNGNNVVYAERTTTGKPLDFSFLKITEIAALKKENARGGIRKPILQDEDEEENKKDNTGPAVMDNEVTEEKDNKEQEKVIRAPLSQQINTILQNANISLNQNKNQHMGRKAEDNKAEAQKKMVIRTVTRALFLQNNQLRNLKDMSSVLMEVMYNSQQLQWIDLSYNYLESIDRELLNFPQLRTLYLHCNYISNMEEVRKLQELDQLRNLTLYGNQIEKIKGYRLFVLGVMFQKGETLHKLDSVLISKGEFNSVIVWNERLNSNVRLNQLTKKIENLKKPPEENIDEEDKKQQQNQQQQPAM